MSYNLVNELFSGLIKGNRASLSRAITLIESKNCNKISAETRKQLIRAVNEYHMKTRPKTIRIGVSGGPGCGKSTFIESFGMNLIEKYNKKIAVLAIDPSSAINGGSILADKTRMSNLTKNLSAFIRPSPTGGHLGGVTQSTGEQTFDPIFCFIDISIIISIIVNS
jgi:LAO/AO transport system kinase